jgi:mono/diheme cytochrome c family protein
MSAQKRMCGVIAVGVMAVLIGTAARAQNLDEGKSAAALFANGCAACHRSPRGLAKGRFRLTLFAFLQQHYSTSSSTAWELTSYLESVDGPPRGPPRRPGAPKPRHSALRPDGDPVVRPPAPVR